jgi:hypothetical protein
LFSAEKPDERILLKSAYLDLFISQSPLVLMYLAKLCDHISLQIPSSPFDFSPFYKQQLVILGSYLRRGGFSPFHEQFLSQEARTLENPGPQEICQYFPEWLAIPVGSPSSPSCTIKLPPLDPVSNHFDVSGAIQSFRYFTRQYRALIGFPFWEILPYWLRIFGVNEPDADSRDPTVEQPPRESFAFQIRPILPINCSFLRAGLEILYFWWTRPLIFQTRQCSPAKC